MARYAPVALAVAPPFPGPTTLRESKLMCADVAGNNNKFYTLQLQQSSTCHQNHRLSIATALRVTRPAEAAVFRHDLCGEHNETRQLLFHGTRRSTAAGILTRGFLSTRAATSSGGHYSGSAFGDGIYFASNAGKSLGYTDGGTGRRPLFVAYVAMGRSEIAGWGGYGFRRAAGYDSVWATTGKGLAHDEMIVPSPDRTLICYLLLV